MINTLVNRANACFTLSVLVWSKFSAVEDVEVKCFLGGGCRVKGVYHMSPV